jgi:hypothetical protein
VVPAMSKEAFDAIRNDVVAAQSASGEVEILRNNQEPSDVYYLVQRGKEPQRKVAARNRDDTLNSVADVIAVCDDSLTRGKKTVWVNESTIVVNYSDADDARTLDRATYHLEHSPEFTALLALEHKWSTGSEKGIGQKDFITLLKTKFWEAFASQEERVNLIKLLSRLVKSGTSDVGNGKSGTFNDVRAAAILGQSNDSQPSVDLPDEVQFRCEVFLDSDVSTACDVKCLIDINAEATEFKLIPISSHLITAKQAAVLKLKNHLRNDLVGAVVVLSGKP